MSDNAQTPPPRGDIEKAEKYINWLIDLLNQRKIDVYHTDLQKFDPTSLKDHYTIVLKDYQIEISHSQNPQTGKNSYVMIFNNLKNISQGSGEKIILAYTYLADSQFSKFKMVAEARIDARKRAEEEARFNQALEPIDKILDGAKGESGTETKTHELKSNLSSYALQNPPQIHQV